MVDSAIPQDWRDLLIRLDQKVGDGFASIDRRLDAYDRRVESLDARVIALETAEVKRAGELAGAQRLGSYLKVAVSSLVAIVAYLGYQVELAPKHNVVNGRAMVSIPRTD